MPFWQMEFSNITTVLELHSYVRRLVCTCGHYRFVALPAGVVTNPFIIETCSDANIECGKERNI